MLPFEKFPGADTLLGPEMRSTGEVMGIDDTFAKAYAKAAIAAGNRLPLEGNVFITMVDKYKQDIAPVARQLKDLGYGIIATEGGWMGLVAVFWSVCACVLCGCTLDVGCVFAHDFFASFSHKGLQLFSIPCLVAISFCLLR